MFNSIDKVIPAPSQESVWDYPRPPKLEPVSAKITIIHDDITIADTCGGYRVLETSHPPVYYLPPDEINMELLRRAPGQSFCEWKGVAHYCDVVVKDVVFEKVGWYYPQPTAEFEEIANYVAFYAAPFTGCYVNGEKVTPQPGNFYGGWITSNIVGPFKGEPGSWGW